MRFQTILLVAGLSLAGAAAQAQVGAFGACILEDASGAPINVGPCELKPAECNPEDCLKVFHWQGQDFNTMITGGGPFLVHEGFKMDGHEAYAPQGMLMSDPRDCIYNAFTDGVFCFINDPEGEAHLLSADGLSAYDALMALAERHPMPSDISHDHDHDHEGEGNTGSDEINDGKGDEIAGLLELMQGKYRPVPSWNCGEIGRDGGATAIQGPSLLGLETECQLTDGKVVGRQGALLFKAQCTGEGSTWEDEYLLRRDEWGSLVVSSLDGANVWQACE